MSSSYEGKSGVNVKRLVQNIADQYPFEPQKAAIIELVANSLDAKASKIEITFNKEDGFLSVKDDGVGMDKRQFREYHDFAASSKTRGKGGIGFAGQGAKLALNFCKKVLSETMSICYKGYSEWFLKGNDAPYKIFDETVISLNDFGTKVTLYLDSESIDFYTEDLIKEVICEHYMPLLDPEIKEFYKDIYKDGIKIFLNGREIILDPPIKDLLDKRNKIENLLHKREKVLGFFGKVKESYVFPSGVMVCSYGKVIERTFFKKEPREKEKITGWIEAPFLIEAVTTDKCRFQAGNKVWEGFFRKAQSEFSKWLEEIGLLEKAQKREGILDYTKLEKEINSILKNIPELSFFSSRTQRDVALPDESGEKRSIGEGIQKVEGTKCGETSGEGVAVYPGEESGNAPTLEPGKDTPATPKPRIIRGGITITEDERTDIEREAWFDGETVTINKSHPAYIKAKANELLNYHLLKCVIMSLIEFNMERDPDPSYQKVYELQQKFFRLWGEH